MLARLFALNRRSGNEGHGMLAFLRWTFKRLPTPMFLPLCSTMVSFHCQYCVQVIAPTLTSDIAKLEKVQWLASRCVLGMWHLSYPERLKHIKLFSFRRRRMVGDPIETYTIFRGFVSVNPREFFSLRESMELRGHHLTLAKQKVHTIIQQDF